MIDYRTSDRVRVKGTTIFGSCLGFTKEGLPVGIQIVGRYRDEFGILQFAKAFEDMTEVWKKIPDIAK